MSNDIFKIYFTGSEEQAEYVKEYSLLKDMKTELIGLTNKDTSGSGVESLPKTLKKMVFLDLPDIIIAQGIEDKLIMGIEITEQVPFGYNMTQRFARCVASAIQGIPFAFILPQRKYDFYPSSGTGNWRHEWRLFKALERATEIHDVPILPFLWPVDESKYRENGGLIYNKDQKFRFKHIPPSPSEDKEIKEFFDFTNKVIEGSLKGSNTRILLNDTKLLERSKETGRICDYKYIDPNRLKILELIETQNIAKYFKDNTILNETAISHFLTSAYYKNYITQRKHTLFIRPTANPLAGSRGYGDPYAGTSLAFDYILCRTNKGKTPLGRDINLVLFFDHENALFFWKKLLGNNFDLISKITSFDNLKGDPFQEAFLESDVHLRLRKEIRTFFYIADVILLREKILF